MTLKIEHFWVIISLKINGRTSCYKEIKNKQKKKATRKNERHPFLFPVNYTLKSSF